MATLPVLARFEIQVLKNKSASDAAQIPTAATIRLFRQGATASAAAYVPYNGGNPDPVPVDVAVLHLGSIRIGDLLQMDVSTPQVLTVADMVSNPAAPILRVINDSNPAGISITVGKRLLRKTGNSIGYLNPTGAIFGATSFDSFATNASTGRAACYVAAYRYDYAVEISGSATRLYIDAVGSYVMR